MTTRLIARTGRSRGELAGAGECSSRFIRSPLSSLQAPCTRASALPSRTFSSAEFAKAPSSSSLFVRSRPLLVFNLPEPLAYAQVWRWQQRIVRGKVAAERALKEALRRTDEQTDSPCANPLRSAARILSEPGDRSAAFHAGLADVLLLVEHEPVYTLGRNASLQHLRFPPHARLSVAERGDVSGGKAADSVQASRSAGNDDAGVALSDAHATASSSVASSTIATAASDSFAASPSFQLLRVERGGEVTYHGPGQLVMYPLLSLQPTAVPYAMMAAADDVSLSDSSAALCAPSPFRADLHWYLRSLESVVLRFLRLYGVEGQRVDGASGVWVQVDDDTNEAMNGEDAVVDSSSAAAVASSPSAVSVSPSTFPPLSRLRKIAAVGLSCSAWVSMHGCALNLDADLTPFGYIVPCGLSAESGGVGGVTSLQQVMRSKQRRDARENGEASQEDLWRVDHTLARAQLLQCFREEFSLPEPAAVHTQPFEWIDDNAVISADKTPAESEPEPQVAA